jgi:hypothetical protein
MYLLGQTRVGLNFGQFLMQTHLVTLLETMIAYPGGGRQSETVEETKPVLPDGIFSNQKSQFG